MRKKTHGITGFLTASRRETKTSRKEKNPMLKFSQGNKFADRYFSRGSRCCSNDNWAQRKADNKRNWTIKKVLKLQFNPSHFLDDKCSKNKQPSLAGAETVQVLRLSAQRHAKRSVTASMNSKGTDQPAHLWRVVEILAICTHKM